MHKKKYISMPKITAPGRAQTPPGLWTPSTRIGLENPECSTSQAAQAVLSELLSIYLQNKHEQVCRSAQYFQHFHLLVKFIAKKPTCKEDLLPYEHTVRSRKLSQNAHGG